MAIITEDVNYDPPTNSREDEMARLLGLIDAEWRSDPTSVACFDLRIVEDARKVLDEHKRCKAQEAKYLRRPFRLR